MANVSPYGVDLYFIEDYYLKGRTLTLDYVYAYDSNGYADIACIDFRLRQPNGTWLDLPDATRFTMLNGTTATTTYSYSLGNLPVGTYTLAAVAYDREGAASPATQQQFEIVQQLSGTHYIDTLLYGTKWGSYRFGAGANVTYSFMDYGSSFINNYGNEPSNNFKPLTIAQKNAVRNALASISQVADLQFTEIPEVGTTYGDMRFGRSGEVNDSAASAYAYYPGQSAWAGDIWFGYDAYLSNVARGTYGYETFLHEIGHALGLKHPFEVDGIGGRAHPSIDNTFYTVMSYTEVYTAARTMMLHDIAALQHIYGANMSTRTGNTVYSWAKNEVFLETIWDAGGRDTINWSNQSTAAKINLQAGAFSQYQSGWYSGKKFLAIAYGVTIENAEGGAGNDILIGNRQNNLLRGHRGHDALTGGGGSDVLVGGMGNDTLTGGSGADRFVFDIGRAFHSSIGTDTITDFNPAADLLNLDTTTFTELRRISFQTVNSMAQAQTSTAQITYLKSQGTVYYNANRAAAGFGTGGAIAHLTPGLVLTAANVVLTA